MLKLHSDRCKCSKELHQIQEPFSLINVNYWNKNIIIRLKTSDENHGMRANKDKDPLIVEKGPMTGPREKKVKKAMELLVQATGGWNINHNKQNDKSHIGHEKRNMIDQLGSSNERTSWIKGLCNHIV